jgi:hypothetical protein
MSDTFICPVTRPQTRLHSERASTDTPWPARTKLISIRYAPGSDMAVTCRGIDLFEHTEVHSLTPTNLLSGWPLSGTRTARWTSNAR